MTESDYQPHYRQIEQALRERIATLSPGERLPSDTDLCAEFGVSRMTARNAMQRLAADGLITREPGRGSFVATPLAHRRANRLMTFSREMQRAGRVPSSRVLTRVIRPASDLESTSLGIPARQPVVHLRQAAPRRRRADRARDHGSHRRLRERRDDGRPGPGLAPRDPRTRRLPAASRDRHDRRRRGDGGGCRHLGMRTGEPLLVERRVIEDDDGRRVEATESRYVAGRYALVVQFDVEAPAVDAAR